MPCPQPCPLIRNCCKPWRAGGVNALPRAAAPPAAKSAATQATMVARHRFTTTAGRLAEGSTTGLLLYGTLISLPFHALDCRARLGVGITNATEKLLPPRYTGVKRIA